MNDVARLLAARRSTRAYLDTPIDRTTIEALLRSARTAPSGANLQPGRFHALTGAPLDALKAALTDAVDTNRPTVSEYDWFPADMTPDLKTKQRAAGFALYDALGIDRRDLPGRHAQWRRNYRFFDAPVGVVVTIRRDFGRGGFMDLGMSLLALMIDAEARGLASTGIGALAKYGDLVARHLGLEDREMVVCGIALGHADPDAPVNRFRTDRDALDAYATLRGWDQ